MTIDYGEITLQSDIEYEKSKHGKYLKFLRIDMHVSKKGNAFPRMIFRDEEGNYCYYPIKIDPIYEQISSIFAVQGESELYWASKTRIDKYKKIADKAKIAKAKEAANVQM
jgi:hypothetical protein